MESNTIGSITIILIGITIIIISIYYFYNNKTEHTTNTSDNTSTDKTPTWCMMMKLTDKNECVLVPERQQCMSGQVFKTQHECQSATHFGQGF
jgi:hypothetical protein